MGTDRDLWGAGPCPCGNGKITVMRCSPDHPWGGRAWFENSIECAECARNYTFAESGKMQDDRSRLVRRQDVEEREDHRKEWRAKNAEILAMASAQQILAQAQSALDQERSVAAKHRLLSRHGLADGSVSTFRKRFSGSAHYLRGLSAWRLPRLMQLAGRESPEVVAALSEAEKINIKTGISGLVE
jgi:hypothetical protein